jgi:hypothetical protein
VGVAVGVGRELDGTVAARERLELAASVPHTSASSTAATPRGSASPARCVATLSPARRISGAGREPA